MAEYTTWTTVADQLKILANPIVWCAFFLVVELFDLLLELFVGRLEFDVVNLAVFELKNVVLRLVDHDHADDLGRLRFNRQMERGPVVAADARVVVFIVRKVVFIAIRFFSEQHLLVAGRTDQIFVKVVHGMDVFGPMRGDRNRQF